MTSSPKTKRHALDDGEVAREDRIDEELPETRYVEDLFDDDRSPDEKAEVDGEDGDGRDQRVSKAVLQHYSSL